jgi:signal transduction histidine kinase
MPYDGDLDVSYYYDELSKLNNELINAKRELAKTNMELERVAAIKDLFLTVTSHDLRSLLAGILSGINLLQNEKSVDEATRELWLAQMAESAEFMLRLIEDILDTEAIESGKLRIDMQIGDLAHLLKDALRSAATLAARRKIELIARLPQDSVPALIDAVRMRQVFNNLLSNAIKFSTAGAVVWISLERDEGSIVIRVIDQGCGIGKAHMERLFAPFSSGSARSIDGERNTGMGLFIAKSIVEAHGGTLAIESEEGRGTSVELRIPAP